MMDSSSDNIGLFTKKNVIYFLLIAILMVAIPLGIKLIQTQTQLKSRATGSEIKFVEKKGEVECTSSECTTNKTNVEVEIQAPTF